MASSSTSKASSGARKALLIGNNYPVEMDLDGYGNFVLKKPTKISRQGRGMTTLVGFGLRIEGKKSDGIVEIEELTIKGGKGQGLCAYNGMKVIMRGCTVEECQSHGVGAERADISCDDLQVIGCGQSGVLANGNATITLSGQGTNIQKNVTTGYCGSYGLYTNSSSSIHIVHPLTKKQISTNNGGGRNWGGSGTIEQVDHDGVVLQILEEGQEDESDEGQEEEFEGDY